jgi:hypothetical protein
MKIHTLIISILIISISIVSCTKGEETEIYQGQKFLLNENFDSDANISISQIYKATGTTYNSTSLTLNGIMSITASSIVFTPAISTDKTYVLTTVPGGSGIKGVLSYTDGLGGLVNLPGVVSKQNSTSATTGVLANGLSFVPTTDGTYSAYTGNAYLLVLPNREGSFAVGTNVSVNATPQTDNVLNSVLLAKSYWSTYSQTGVKNWSKSIFSDNGYATFSSFQSGDPTNNAWLISPTINMDSQEGEKLFFQTAQDGFVRSRENSLELYVSSDYDGVIFANASWERLDFNFPNQDTPRFKYLDSGIIDLSSYKGKLHFAFKIKGTSSLTGGYQLDNVKVFY